VIRFSEFSADAEAGELFRKGSKVKLQGQPFEVLLILLGRPGKVVTREELRSKLWPSDTFVDFEHGLNAAVNRLRDALGDSADEPKFIETVPRRGYRFVGAIEGAHSVPPLANDAEPDSSTPPGISATKSASDPPTAGTRRWQQRNLILASLLLVAIALGFFLVHPWAKRSGAVPQRVLTRVTFDSGLQIGATWSPDGRYIAYASNRGGKFDIWLQQVSGGDPVQVTKGPAANWEPDWSPDGKYIAYRSEEGEGGIFIEPAIGGAGMARKISSIGHFPRWSPDGTQILLQSTRFGLTSKIFVVSISDPDSVKEIMPEVTSGANIVSAVWHPDGKRASLWGWELAPTPLPTLWTGAISNSTGVVKSDLTAEASKILRDLGGSNYNAWGDSDFKLSWAPNGNELYFERMLGGARNIWRMRVDSKNLRGESIDRITTGSEVETEFSLSPDGTRIAFTSLSEQVRTWVFPLDAARGQITGPGSPVTNVGLEAWEGSLSRDGTKLAYSAKKAGRSEIWQTDLVHGTESIVAADDIYLRDEPHWSADGKRLAYVRLKSATREVQAVLWDTDTRSEKPLTEPQKGALFIYGWAPDGKSILASANNSDTERFEVWQIPTHVFSSGRKDWRLIAKKRDVDIFQARFSPDGRWIAFEAIQDSAKSYRSAIYLVPSSGGEWIQLTDGLHWDDKPHWSSDGHQIYFISEGGSFYNVYRLPIDLEHGKPTGTAVQVTSFKDPSLMVARVIPTVEIDVAQDKLMVTTSQNSGSIWVLDKVNQ
jgi:Tol biopolymer transport system component/DNA-binding winged helix-turn-helix (wHTH) protein